MSLRNFLFAASLLASALLIALVAFLLFSAGNDDDDRTALRIGLLLNVSDTGDPDTQAATRLALEDVMAHFPDGEAPFEVELVLRGTGLDPEVAHTQLQAMADSGIEVVVGPESSAELEHIRGLIDEHDMLSLSHCASAPSLAIEDDRIYRMVPSDAHQAKVISSLLYDAGTRRIVPIWRGDIWGDGISEALRQAFESLGGEVSEGVRYDPDATAFDADLEALAAQVTQPDAPTQSAIAVVFLGFGPEVPAILAGAADHTALREVTWFGSEGSVLSRELTENPEAARFAVETGFVHPMFADVKTPHSEDVRSRISAAIGGGAVHYCAMAAYDAVWLAVLSAAISGSDDADDFEGALNVLTRGFEGASGHVEFDAAGDRTAVPYDLWSVQGTGTSFAWEQIEPASQD